LRPAKKEPLFNVHPDVPKVNHELVKAIESGIPSTHFLVCSVGTVAEKIAGCLGLPLRS
jgi:hypothetical protein